MLRSQYSHFQNPTGTQTQEQCTQNVTNYLDNTMMEQSSPTFGPLQFSDAFEGPSTPPPQMVPNLQKEQRTRFVLRLAILLQRFQKIGDQNNDFSPVSTKSRLLIKKVKQLIRYATHRNRLGDPRFTPLVDSIERCLKDFVGCEEWFSICVEAEQRSRVRMLSQIIVSSTMQGSSNTSSPIGHPSTKSDFSASFFP